MSIGHTSVPAPCCDGCQRTGSDTLDVRCAGCKRLLTAKTTTTPQLFAVLRQFDPATQECADLVITELLSRGVNVNDRDSLSDMNLLHFGCKAGGIADSVRTTPPHSSPRRQYKDRWLK